MLPGETIVSGCPVVWPNCEADVLPLVMLHSSSGHDIDTRHPCGPSYRRESNYGRTWLAAEAALAGCCSFGRGGVARDVATCRPEQAQPSVAATGSLASQIRLALKRTARHLAQLLTGRSTTDVVEDDISRSSRSRRFNVTVLHNSGRGRFFGYEAGDTLVRVFDLSVSASGVEAAAEVVFTVANSYPGELFCEPTYADVVAEYRAGGLRSLSVGDVLIIADHTGVKTAWACAPAGFDQLDGLPDLHQRLLATPFADQGLARCAVASPRSSWPAPTYPTLKRERILHANRPDFACAECRDHRPGTSDREDSGLRR